MTDGTVSRKCKIFGAKFDFETFAIANPLLSCNNPNFGSIRHVLN